MKKQCSRIRNKKQRVTAWVLVMVMLMSLIMVPAGKVQAAESVLATLSVDTSIKTVTTNSEGQVDIRFSAPTAYDTIAELKAAGATKYTVTFKVTACESTGYPGGMAYFGYGSEWKNTNSWANIVVGSEVTSTLDISGFLSGSESVYAYGVQFSELTANTTFTYQIVSAKLWGTGSSSGSTTDNDTGTDFLGDNAEYNYAKLLEASLYFYDANMCGSDVSERSSFSWRSDCHEKDKEVIYNGKTVDLSGGYHDAGDHAKFGLPQAYSASVLGMSYYEYKDVYEELGLTAHYKRIMDHFVEYFKRCTILDDSGNVEAFCYQVGSGNTDHSYWGAPENQAARNNSEQIWFTSSSVPATDIVCETAAALAIYAYNFDDAAAEEYAIKLFDYADSFSNKEVVKIEGDASNGYNPFYNSTKYEDDYALAAAWLYKLTNESDYKTKYTDIIGSQNWLGWVLCWDDVTAAAFLYGPNIDQKQYVAKYINDNKGQVADNNYCNLKQSWGTARYNCALQYMGLAYEKQTSTGTDLSAWANGQMHYLLGNNSATNCYVVGYNSNSVHNAHHRAASGYDSNEERNQDAEQGCPNYAYTLVGALVGGPASTSAAYADEITDYNENEVALDYNAGLVAAAAGLYYYINTKGTSEEKSAQFTVGETTLVPSDEYRKITDTTSNVANLSANAVNITGVEFGYNSTEGTLYVKNSGTVDASSITLALAGGDSSNFQLGSTSIDSITANGGTQSITISLKTGLSVGTYSDTVKITYNNGTEEKTVSVRVSATVSKASNVQVAAPILVQRASNSITIKAGTENVEQEYVIVKEGDSLTDASWNNATTSTVFSNLTGFTKYDIYARAKETDTKKAGAISNKLTVYTLVEDPFTIDVSKLGDSNYVDALRINHGQVSIRYSNGVLELIHSATSYPNGYTITGNNSNVTVKTNSGSYKVNLVDAKIGSLDVSLSNGAKIDLIITGDVTIENGIIANTRDVDLAISGTGTLKADYMETAGDVSMTDVTIQVDATNIGKAAISAGNITITGGNVSATGDTGYAAMTATGNIQLEDATVKVDTGTEEGMEQSSAITVGETGKIIVEGSTSVSSENSSENLFSVDPVDAQGNVITQCSVTLIYEDGTQVIVQIKKDQSYTLPAIPEKKGYKQMWQNGDTRYAEGASYTVSEDVTFTVYNEVVYVEKLQLSEKSKTLTEGDTFTLTATVSPTNALDTSVTWTSDNTAVATVDQNGKVTAVAAGTAKISVSTNDVSNLTASCEVTVEKKQLPDDEQESESDQNNSNIHNPVVNPGATQPTITPDASVEDTSVAVQSVKITGPTKKVAPGKKISLKATIYPENATNQEVVWKVSNSKYATVNNKGVVTTKKAGKGKKVTVTAYSVVDNSIQATYKISVMKNAVKKIKLSAKTKTIKKGKSVTIKAKFTPSKGISKELVWTSSNKKVATVNSKGKVIGKKKGTVKITAKAKDGSGKKATIKIRVK